MVKQIHLKAAVVMMAAYLLVSLEVFSATATKSSSHGGSLADPCIQMVARIQQARSRNPGDQDFETFLRELQVEVHRLHGASPHYQMYVDVTGKFWPIFQKGGLLGYGVKAELVKRGVSSELVGDALRWFRDFSPEVQLEFVRAVFRRMDNLIPRSLRFESVDQLAALASKFHMSTDEARLLVRLWGEYRSKSDLILASILVVLKNGEVQFKGLRIPMLAQARWVLSRMRKLFPSSFRIFRSKKRAEPESAPHQPWTPPSSPRDLIAGDDVSTLPPEHLSDLLNDQALEISLKAELIEELLGRLSFQQVRLIAETDAVFSQLPPALRQRIGGILSLGSRLRERLKIQSGLQSVQELQRSSELEWADFESIGAEFTSERLAELLTRQVVTRWTMYEYLIGRYQELVGSQVIAGKISRRQFWILTNRLASTMADNASHLDSRTIEAFFSAVRGYARKYAYTSASLVSITHEMNRIFSSLRPFPSATSYLKDQHGKIFIFAKDTVLIPDGYADGIGEVESNARLQARLSDLGTQIDRDLKKAQADYGWPRLPDDASTSEPQVAPPPAADSAPAAN